MKGFVLHFLVISLMTISAIVMMWILDVSYKSIIIQLIGQVSGYFVGLTVKDKYK